MSFGSRDQRRLFDALADKAMERVRAARRIADGCRHDASLHRAAMKAVFVMEDTLFALRQLAAYDCAAVGRHGDEAATSDALDAATSPAAHRARS